MNRIALVVGAAVAASLIHPTLAPIAHANPAAAAVATPVDPTLEKLLDLIKGHFTNGDRGIVFFEVATQDAGRMLIGEFFRHDAPSQVEGQVLFQFIRRSGEIYLRTARFPAGSRTAPGLWAAPEAMPMLAASGLDILADLKVTVDSESEPTSFEATSGGRVPVFLDRAVEMTTQINGDRNGMVIEEIGFDTAGVEAWRFPEAGVGMYKRVDAPAVEVTPEGLIMIDLKAPADPAARVTAPGDTFSVAYTGWTPNGFMFDSSRQEGRQPYTTPIPGRLVQGWNMGIPGMKVGQQRRLLIPPALGYGDRGNPQGGIPGGAWLIFDVEVVDAQPAAPALDPAAAPAAPVTPKP
jgi:FKBP-type peptidyl-prolyl cis-trans isomerase FkpA